MAVSQILYGQYHIWDIFVLGLKTKCRKNNQIHFPMDKGLTVPKWVLIAWPKIPQSFSAQFVCPSPKVWDTIEKRLHRASVVRGTSLVQRLMNHLENTGP